MQYDHYSISIEWSEEDQVYIANVPELPGCMTHGQTYEEAVHNIIEVKDLWIETALATGMSVPPPRTKVA